MIAESPEMSADDWRHIAHLWAHMASMPISQPDEAVAQLWRGLSKLVPYDVAVLMLMHRGDRDRRAERQGYFEGWVMAQLFPAPGSYKPSNQPYLDEFQRERIQHDEWTCHFLETSGEHRTFIRQDVLGERPWSTCEQGWLMERLEFSDRMHTAHVLDEFVEVFLFLDRREPTPFEPRDRDVLHEFNKGLGPFWARLAMSYGLYEHQKALTRRQRETLLHLLDGYSEAEIADRMGLTTGSAHQYVVAVFRALNVNSRAELMAKWMGDLGVEAPQI